MVDGTRGNPAINLPAQADCDTGLRVCRENREMSAFSLIFSDEMKIRLRPQRESP